MTIAHRDGSTEQSILVMEPGQVEFYAIQLEQAIAKREAERRRDYSAVGR